MISVNVVISAKPLEKLAIEIENYYINSDYGRAPDCFQRLEKEYNFPYLYSDFKKRDGYKRSIELSHEYNLYRQDYCGCKYSKNKYEE